MDLPYVHAAVQWRATCDMCDLWQRFGRVARETGNEGTGILFYEKAHLDDSRDRKKTNAEAKKRKAIEDGNRPAKRPATDPKLAASSSSTQAVSSHAWEIGMADPVVVVRETNRKASYAKRAPKEPTKKAKATGDEDRREVDICGPLDDFINARGRDEVSCRRAPVKLYFDGPIRIPGEFPKA